MLLTQLDAQETVFHRGNGLGFVFSVSQFSLAATIAPNPGFNNRSNVKPQHQHKWSPRCCPYISYGTSWENLIKHQHIPSLVIITLVYSHDLYVESSRETCKEK